MAERVVKGCISADHARYDMFLRLLSEYEEDGKRVLWHDQRHGRLTAVSPLDGRLYPIQGERFRALGNTVLRECVPLPPGVDEWKVLSIPEGEGAYRAVIAGLMDGMLPGVKVWDPLLDECRAVAWDGVPRLEICPWRLRSDPLGVAPHVLRKLVMEPILRAYGHTVAAMGESLLLHDPVGGVGKSAVCRDLWGPQWHLPMSSGFHASSAYDRVATWAPRAVIELAEMAVLEGMSISALKPLLDEVPLVARVPGTGREVSRRRLFSVVGTTNKRACLPDQGGLRRWLGVDIEGVDPAVCGGEGGGALYRWLQGNRQQLLAEGLAEYTAAVERGEIGTLLPAFWQQDQQGCQNAVQPFLAPDRAAMREAEREAERDDLAMVAGDALCGGEHVGMTMKTAQGLMKLRSPQELGRALRALGWEREKTRLADGSRPKIWHGPDWDGETVVRTLAEWEEAVRPRSPEPPEPPEPPPSPEPDQEPDSNMGLSPQQKREFLAAQGFVPPSEDTALVAALGNPETFPLPNQGDRRFHRPNRLRAGIVARKARDADVVAFTACFMECDRLSVPAQWQQVQEMPLPPTHALWTGGKSLHLYWKLPAAVPADEATTALWKSIQRGLAQRYNGDAALCNPSRAMASPTATYRDGTEPMVWTNPDGGAYPLAALARVYAPPPAPPPAPRAAPRVQRNGRHNGRHDGTAWEQFCQGVRSIPLTGAGTGTWEGQLHLASSALEWAIVEQRLDETGCKAVVVEHLQAVRGGDVQRLVHDWWRPGKHGRGTFVKHCQLHGVLPRRG